MTLGRRLKTAREKKGLTQAELGRLLGVTDATVAKKICAAPILPRSKN
ncbi:MAG: helix-turn-helix transcriptional regulator [Desulfotomaculaceae bacterium]|nr:helix-turn-helix transcriptional regulator [Desulfotomaculaceae bacterium]